jgi:hypothetical protein
VSIEGTVDLVGPDDDLPGVAREAVPNIFHEIYAAAIGGAADAWAARDRAIDREGHVAVLVTPTRTYSNTPGHV